MGSCITQGAQPGAMWQLRGVQWDKGWDGGSRGRGHIYILRAGSCCYVAETNTTL